MIKYVFLIFFGMMLSMGQSAAQEINQFDANGKRHGVWKKKYPKSDQLRYEGQFNHGKETGVFKFYCADCKKQPNSIRTYKGGDTAKVQYFSKNGTLVSEGNMIEKNRVGEWTYYHKNGNTVLTKEFYKNSKLDGKKTTYYPNGQLTEEIHYVVGSKEGKNNYYAPNGVLLKKLFYANNKLQGEAEYYDAAGNVTIQGQYKDGKKDGLWKYFKDGKLELEETYPKPLKKS